MSAIRGATTSENTAQAIAEASIELIENILESNGISSADVDAVFFSCTEDLNAAYPATAVRKYLKMPDTAFMCLKEMSVEDDLKECIRASVFTSAIKQAGVRHVYLRGAKILRPDLTER